LQKGRAKSVAILAFSKNKKLYQRDPSFIYRCMNLASSLEKKNALNFIGHFKDYKINKNTQYILLHRPIYSLSLEFFVRRMKQKGIKVIADVDDLIIHPDFSEYSPAVVNNILSNKKISQRFLKNFKALKLCDHIICSTEQLKAHLNQYFMDTPVTVLYNCIYHSWGKANRSASPIKKVTYFSGTNSHDRDFALIKEPLEAFFNETPSAQLDIIGPLKVSLNIKKDQLTFIDKVPFLEYESLVRRSDVNLAPLETSIFNHCKSGLKAIEAGAFGTPTIFSPNGDAERFSNSSVLIATTSADWYAHLTSLFDPQNTFNHSLCYDDTVKKANLSQMTDKFCSDVINCDDV
jgi:glycosyltransferase involved in cell wall biosynthesis